MFLPLRGKPRLDVCRDGGSIDASFTDFWGNSFLMSLPIRWGGDSKETIKVIGYKAPTLIQYIKTKKISKGSGKPYFLTNEREISINKNRALTISKKLLKAAKSTEEREIALDLVYGIESDGQQRNS